MNEQAPNNRSYTLADIEQYLLGRLSPAEMHAMEKAALQDPLLADAIEGYRGSGMHIARTHLQDIQQQLLQQKDQAPVVKGHFAAKRWWRAAAVIIALAGVGGTGWYFMHSSVDKQEIAVNSKSIVSIPVKPDTVATQPVQPPVVAQTSPTDKKRLPATHHHIASQPPIADGATAPSPKAEPATEALTDIRPEKAVSRAFAPQQAEHGKTTLMAAGQQQPLMLRGRTIKNADTSRNSNLSESIVSDYTQQQAAAHTTQHPTAPVDSLNLSPAGGWDHFNEYLSNKLGSDTHGEVVADLVLDNAGKIIDIIIIRAFDRDLDALGRAMNRKIKLALLNGPVWLAGNTKKAGTFRLNLEF